ncbi:MAG: hypothetical protein AAF217_01995 [Pseudomonadota bacterium]
MTDRKAKYSVSQAFQQAEAVKQVREKNKNWAERRQALRKTSAPSDGWRRESRVLPRAEARHFARQFLKKYPKAAYWSEVESWRVLEGDIIEFTMRRLHTSD